MTARHFLSGTLVLLLVLAFAMMLLSPGVALADINEFQDPTWTQLPAVSAYNTTPSCALSTANYYQCAPSSLPPEDPSNPERYLNSAYWPAEKRPDIEMYAVQKYGYDYQNCAAKLPHYCFLLDAEAVGFPVTHTPQVGDLWLAPGECLAWGGSKAALPAGCTDNADDWYLGYVEQVFPDGSFIQSWGGTGPADSGLGESWFSGEMDPYSSFIHLMPAGSPLRPPPPLLSNNVNIDAQPDGAAVQISVTSDAPDSMLVLTGPRQLTPALDSDGNATVRLSPGDWTACASSGGGTTGYQPGRDCTSFTIYASPDLRLSGLSGSATNRYVILASSLGLVGRQAKVVIRYFSKVCARHHYPRHGWLRSCSYSRLAHRTMMTILLHGTQHLPIREAWVRADRRFDINVSTQRMVVGSVPYAAGHTTRVY